jgi:hypothetical protein
LSYKKIDDRYIADVTHENIPERPGKPDVPSKTQE